MYAGVSTTARRRWWRLGRWWTLALAAVIISAVVAVHGPARAGTDGGVGEDPVCGYGHVTSITLPLEHCEPPCPGVAHGPTSVGSTAEVYLCLRP